MNAKQMITIAGLMLLSSFFGAVFASFFLIGTPVKAGDEESSKGIRTEGLQITDKKGNTLIHLGIDQYGEPFITMTGKEGEKLWSQESDESAIAGYMEKDVEVIKTDGGLRYQILSQGKGDAVAKKEDTVTVHYRGWLIDGSEFDSSYKRGTPASFPLTGVIQGWTVGVSGMKVGEKRRLFIPSEMAYGTRGRPGIPPNSFLLFDVELISIDQ